MADDLGTVGIVWAELGLRADAYNVGMATAARTAETTATRITRTMTRLAGAGVGLYAITRGIKEVVDAFVSFDRELHNIWTLTDYTAEKMQQLGEELRAVAREYNVTATQAAKAMYQIYSATFYGADAMKILEASMKGAAAGLSDVFTAADMTTTVLNAYRMSAEEATYVNDLLFTSVRFGKTTYSELSAQFGRLAGVAAPAGARVEEMTAAIATLTRQGIETDWAVTSLRQTIMQILRPGKELQDVISALGYVSGRALVETHGFAEAVGMIGSYADKTGIRMEQLFSNVRAVTAVLPLATTAAGEFRKDLRRMGDAAGQMQGAFEKASQSWPYQLTVLKTHLQDTAISMGKIFLPAMKSVLDIVLLLSKGFALISEALVAIGGAHALAAIAVLGSVFALYKVGSAAIVKANAALLAWIASTKAATGATAELAAATAALNWQWATTSTAAPAAAVATTGAAGVMGGIRGALAKGVGGMTPLALLGTGLGALLGAGMAIQGALQLNIALKAAVTGEGEVRGVLEGSLKNALGYALGGAMVAKLFGATGMGLVKGGAIGAALAAGTTLSIYIYHIVKQAAAMQEARREILRGTMAESVGALPERISAGDEAMRGLFDQLRQLNPEIEDTTAFFNALRDVMGEMYEVDYAGLLKSVDWVMEEQYERMKAVSSALGVILDPEDIESMAADWKERLTMEVMDGLTGIPEAVARFMPMMLKDELAELETKSISDLTKEEMASFLGFLVDEVRGWAESIEGVSLEAATSALRMFFAAIDEIARAETLPQAAAGIKRWQESFKGLVDEMTDEQRFALFQRIIATWADDMVATYATALGEAIGVPMDAVAEFIGNILNPEIEATAEAIPSVAEQLEAVREEFYELLGEITAGDITLDQASKKWDELKKKVSGLEGPLEMAEALNLDYADAIRDVYDELQAAIGAAEDAAGAVKLFTDALNSVKLVAGARENIEALFRSITDMLLRASTTGQAADIVGGIISGGAMIEGLQTNLERIFGPGSTFTTAAQEWARQMHALISDTFPRFGLSLEELTQETERLAEAQRRAAKQFADIITEILQFMLPGDMGTVVSKAIDAAMAVITGRITAEDIESALGPAAKLLGDVEEIAKTIALGITGGGWEIPTVTVDRTFGVTPAEAIADAVSFGVSETLKSDIFTVDFGDTTLDNLAEAMTFGVTTAIEALAPTIAVPQMLGGPPAEDAGVQTAAEAKGAEISDKAIATAALAEKLTKVAGVVSAVIALLDYIKSLADEGIAMMNEALQEAANIVRSVFGDLATAARRLTQNFVDLFTSTETYMRLQRAINNLTSKIFDAMMGWAWILVGLFEELTVAVDETTESVQETIDSFNSLNVPTGYKVTRAEWRAARPGEPGELRTIEPPGGTTGGGGVELPEWVTTLIAQFRGAIDSVISVFQSFFDIMSDIWTELGPIVLDGILPSLQLFGERLVKLGQRIQEEVLPALKLHLARTIRGFLNFFFSSIEGAATFFVDTLAAILPNLKLFAQSMGELGATLPDLAAALSDALSPAINTALEGLMRLAGWLTGTMIPGLEAALIGFGKFWEAEVGPFFTKKVFPKILEWATEVYDFISSKVVPFLENTLWPFMESEVWPLFVEIVNDILDALGNLWDDLTTEPDALFEFIKGILEEWGKKVIGGIETVNAMKLAEEGDLVGALKVIWSSESLSLWDQIKLSLGVGLKPVAEALGRLFEALGPVIQVIGGALLIGLGALAVLIDILTVVIRAVLAPFKMLYNAVAWVINLTRSKSNKIPYLEYAEGGIVTKPTLALIGEAGPEAVIPLSTGLPTAESIALGGPHPAYAGAAAGSGDLYYQHTSVVNIGGRTILRVVDHERRHIDKLRSGTAAGRRWERG